jgi:hypothetical protein
MDENVDEKWMNYLMNIANIFFLQEIEPKNKVEFFLLIYFEKLDT